MDIFLRSADIVEETSEVIRLDERRGFPAWEGVFEDCGAVVEDPKAVVEGFDWKLFFGIFQNGFRKRRGRKSDGGSRERRRGSGSLGEGEKSFEFYGDGCPAISVDCWIAHFRRWLTRRESTVKLRLRLI